MKANKLILKMLLLGLGLAAIASKPLAAQTDIATQPLAQPASNVAPNIMLLLDDSGSMVQQYTPDYLGRYYGGTNALCFDAKDDDGQIKLDLDNCEAGDPPIMSPDVNTQYYNPDIRYFPAVNYDGSSMLSMTAANTDNWTEVPTDGVSLASRNDFRKDTYDMNNANEGTVSTADLVNKYPDRVWCDQQSRSGSDYTDPTKCRTNGSYSYPDKNFGYGRNNSNTTFGGQPSGPIKFISGAAYYYRIVPTVYCTDYTLTSCIGGSASPVTAPTGLYIVPAPVRYCNTTPGVDASKNSCQAKYQGKYTIPEFTGNVTSTITAATPATASLTVPTQSDSFSGQITSIFVKGVNIIGSTTINLSSGFSASTAASAIKSAINNNTSTNGGYTATVSSNVVTIKAPSTCTTDCSTWNGASVTVQPNTAPPLVPVSATVTFTVSGASSKTNVTAMSAATSPTATSLIPSTVSCTSCTASTNAAANQSAMATAIANAINAATSTTGYSASASSANVTITSPGGYGYNVKLNVTTTNALVAGNGSTFTGGGIQGDVQTAATNFANGADYSGGRIAVGQFVRTSITPYQAGGTVAKTFPKTAGRSDCAGASVCTYAEEMTNFANWYAYYRTRDTMAKTAIGRAFSLLTSAYRIGFITINPGNPVDSSLYLKVDTFKSGAGNQKDLWYQHVYNVKNNGSTPLRQALSRVGRYFAGVQSGINSGMDPSPIQFSCQPNYVLAMTDGYWNGSGGVDLSGNAVGNQDNTDSGYHTRAIGAYDGALAGSTNTLADVAMYYYQNDLRSDLADNTPTTQTDPAPFQHMTTFTVGLGLAGQLQFDPNYLTQTSGDFFDIKQGTKNWPVPAADSETALDDLWHAAVDGHGQFFSAKDPVTLSQAILTTLQSVSSRVGAGAAAATSNLQPVAGDNFAFTAQYKTVEWTGDLIARTIDLNTGAVAYRALWSAQAQLDQRTAQNRVIYTYDSTDTSAPSTGNGNKLKALCWSGAYATGLYPGCANEAELSSTDLANFNPATLLQAGSWNSTQAASASAQNLVDFLRGDTTNEDTGGGSATDLYRNRIHLLGDIVDAQPAYVKAAPFGYNVGAYAGTDPFYQQFKQSTDGTTGTRIGTVFVAANDGMLHAFETDPDNNPYYQTAGISTLTFTDDAFTGTLNTDPVSGEGAERYAYVPSIVLPELKNLANEPYIHEYTVDGSPVIGDVCFGHTLSTPCASQTNWHTILVAGLNGGGRGFYALDVTDPQNPKGLWEFKGGSAASACLSNAQANDGSMSHFDDCNMGLSFGNPIIVKRKSDGRWVVVVTSGYNNINPGDGQGHLYILDAQTGAILNRVDTGVGCDGVSTVPPCVTGTADPSGLSRISAWVDNAFNDNTALRVYGGDLKGNVWRFDLDPTASDYLSAYKLTTLVDSSGNPQPITARPELGEVQGFTVVYVGTGKLLGTSDMTNKQTQSLYAIRDDLSTSNETISRANMVQQTLTATSASTRTTTSNAVDFTTKMGWFVDLPDSGERVNVDPILQLGTLVVPSNVPSTDSCVAGGYGWINFFDYRTGSFVSGATANMASTKIAASLVVGINVVQLPGGKVVTIVTTADNQQLTQQTPVAPPTVAGRRVTWRELISQ